MSEINHWKHTAKDLIAGTVGGCSGILVGHPLDTIKLRIQTFSGGVGVTRAPSMSSILVSMVQKEGLSSLFRGVTSPLLGNAPMNALCFAGYGSANRFLSSSFPDVALPTTHATIDERTALLKDLSSIAPGLTLAQLDARSSMETEARTPISRILLSGCWAGLLSSIATSPTELMKCRMQVSTGVHPSLYACAKHIVGTEGIRGLYRGMTATLIRDVPATGVYFGVYEGQKRFLSVETHTPVVRTTTPTKNNFNQTPFEVKWHRTYVNEVWHMLVAGGMAGVLSWVVTYPFDTAKSLIQASEGQKTLTQALKQIYAQRGFQGFFWGLGPTCIRAVPVNAVIFVVYEWCLKNINF